MQEPYAEFTNELTQAHRELMLHVADLLQLLDSSEEIDIGALKNELAVIQREVTEHFSFEERDGYMSEVLERRPTVERTVQALYQDHDQLARSLASLLKQAHEAESVDRNLVSDTRIWAEQLRDHEARENKLVQDTFNQEIGAGD